MVKFWLDSGEIKIDGSGDLIHCEDCPCVPPCFNCNSETTPLQVEIVITGVVDNGCGTCESFYNGTSFILDQSGLSPCFWSYSHSKQCLGGFAEWESVDVLLFEGLDGGGAWNKFYQLTLTGIRTVTFRVAIPITSSGDAIDCSVSRSLSFISDGDGGVECDWSGASATLTPQ